jgi:hypothetical protein
MQTDEITKQLTAFATKYGYKLKACASPSHWQLTMRNCKFNVHYGRKGFCVVEAHGLCNIRTATLRELAGHILAITLQQGGDNQSETKATTAEIDADVKPLAYVVFDRAGETKPAAVETPREPAKITSREWAAAFVEKNKRFPHALNYADAGYGQGTQCACPTVGECVLREATIDCCSRNCYTQQLQDYIALSSTKREPTHLGRPQTIEALVIQITSLETLYRKQGTSPTTLYMPQWAEELLLSAINLSHVRAAMEWRANDWRPYSIYGLRFVWGSNVLNVL